MELNAAQRILTLKVVYYGTALGGKTTNLQTIHTLTDPERRTQLISIATRDDRTLFFDLLPMGLGRFFGYDLKLKLYTVPGQIQFEVTRRKVLQGADAVVFVADSQRAQAEGNVYSLKNLRVNLIENKLDPKTTALVLQYNKRDLPDVLSLDEMRSALNGAGVPEFPAVATQGWGVMECASEAVALAFDRIVSGRRLAQAAEARRAASQIRETLLSFAAHPPPESAKDWERARGAKAGAAVPPAAPSRGPARGGADNSQSAWVHRADVKVTDEVDLIEQAVEANVALSEHVVGLRMEAARVERRDRQVRALAAVARLAEEAMEPGRLEKELLRLALEALGLSRGSLLARPGTGPVALRALVGHSADPLASIASPPLASLAERLIAAGRGLLSNDLLTEVFFGEPHREAAGVFSVLFSPLRTMDGHYAGLFLYGTEPDEPFDATDEAFVEAACRIASLARLRALAGASR